MDSMNGWPLIPPDDHTAPKLRVFDVPGTQLHVALRDGSAGFLLVHDLMWVNKNLEPLRMLGGYAYRMNVNNPSVWSNHASGTARDENWDVHPNGVRNTFTLRQRNRYRIHLLRYGGCLRSGIFYTHTPDDMHTEINATLAQCEKRARKLMTSTNGKLILAANPGLEKVIMS